MKKVIDDKMDVGLGFGWLLDRFLVDFGTKLGGKLEPSWHQNLIKWDTKTMSKDWSKNEGVEGREGDQETWGLAP